MGQLLSRSQILDTDDRLYAEVDVPEWGGTVRLRGLNGTERDQFEADSIRQRGNNRTLNLQNLRARLVVAAAVDEEGRQLFSTDDVRVLGRKSAKAIDRLFDKAQELSGMSDADVEELTEGFDDAQNDASTSG